MHNAVLRTLCFYDAVGGVALTKIELYKYLLNSGGAGRKKLSFYDFFLGLKKMPLDNSAISRKRGFYFLSKNKLGYEKRINFSKTGIKKWRRAQKMARALSLLPYTRMVAVTGSLSLNTTTSGSDIDILTVSKTGRIWSTRAIVTAVMHILGKRRHGNLISDRICLNHYITDENPVLMPENPFSAHIFFTLIPLWAYRGAKKAIYDKNISWARGYFPYGREQAVNLRQLSQSPGVYKVKRLIENIMPTYIQQILERTLKFAQTYKIKHNTQTSHASENGMIINDSALVFHHPRPKNQEALYLYEKNLKATFKTTEIY